MAKSSSSSVAFFFLAAIMALLVATAAAQGGDGNNNGGNSNNGGGNNNGQKLGAASCRSALEGAGGESALLARAPSCSSAATSTAAANTPGSPAGSSADSIRAQLDKCCSELRAAVASDERIQPCACLPEVWGEAKGRIAEAGLRGVDATTVEAFAKTCGLKFAGNGC